MDRDCSLKDDGIILKQALFYSCTRWDEQPPNTYMRYVIQVVLMHSLTFSLVIQLILQNSMTIEYMRNKRRIRTFIKISNW